jgi:hypothetical protein
MNSRFRWHVALWIAALAAAGPGARAEQGPQICYIYPAGGRQGTTVQVTVGGQNLSGVTEAYISGDGVQAAVLRHARPLSSQQLSAAMRKLSEVASLQMRRQTAAEEGSMDQAGRLGLQMAEASEEFEICASQLGLDDPSPSGFAEFRRMITNPKRQPNAQIAETVTLRLTLAPHAEPGERELRLKTPSGVTNTLYLHVGQYREYLEKEPNDRTPDGGALTGKLDGFDLPNLESLPVVLNGQIMPGDVDRFRFKVRKGTHLVAAVSARRLIPYLADAVPGWFQATLTLSDPRGNEVAYSDDFRFDPDPVIYYEVPEGGEYVLEIRDAIYRGREDFVYRIVVGEVPFVTGIFPLGGRVGTKTTVEVKGWNLPAAKLTLDGQGKGPGILPVSLSEDKRVPIRVPFALDTLPECLETEPNDEPRSAQRVQLPMIVNGRIDRPGDWDVFCFQGRAGDEVVAEVQARRLGSPLDSLLKLTDAGGKQLAANDDYEDKGAGLTTHHADSQLLIKLPADGTYWVHLGDTQHQGGTAYAYRLRISPARPDFELRVVPSTLNARAGTNVPIAVYALRKDGFAGEIALALRDAPQGFALSGAWIPAGQDQAQLTLAVPPVHHEKPIRLRLEGRSMIQGAEVCRTAVPAEDMMQAFIYHHLVPTEHWMVVASGSYGGALPLTLLGERPVKLPAGGAARIPVSVAKGTAPQEVRLELSEPPKGIAIKELSPDPQGLAVVLSADAKEAKPGLKGNLIVNAFLETPVKAKDGQTQAGTRRTPLGILPAIPFEVAPNPPVAGTVGKPSVP